MKIDIYTNFCLILTAIFLFSLLIAKHSYATPVYEIEEVLHPSVAFIINGENFEAKSFCYDMEEGDQVIFMKGNSLGECASAEILNLRTNQNCKVRCE